MVNLKPTTRMGKPPGICCFWCAIARVESTPWAPHHLNHLLHKTANSPRNSNSTISSQFIAKILPFQWLTSEAGCQALNYFLTSESSPKKWLNSSGMNFCWGTPNSLMRHRGLCGANTVTGSLPQHCTCLQNGLSSQIVTLPTAQD